MTQRVFEADLTWTGRAFESGVQIRIDPAGRITAIGRLGLEPDERLSRQALVPGFVNAHSHAFQRGLRGRGEKFRAGAGTFWSWREAMYDLVRELDAESFSSLVEQAFAEMRRAGITTVGEFHYLHHSTDRADWGFDELVLEAARATGIRLVLLQTYYRTGGIDRPLDAAQRRFASPDAATFWGQIESLESRLEGPEQSLGVVAHSLRAVPPGEIGELYREARRRGRVFHIHLEEQQREIDECRAAYGATPVEVVLDATGSAEGLTAVHCTHTSPEALTRLVGAGASIAVCPLTEANLADGIPDLGRLEAPFPLCLGTDSNARISMLEEMRWLEYGQRLASGERGRLRDADGRIAASLLAAATLGGATALGVDCGRLEPGRWADFVAIDLDHPSVAAAPADSLLETIVFGGGDDLVAGTWVGGRA